MKKFDPKVIRLGYVALATADVEEHYLETIGLTGGQGKGGLSRRRTLEATGDTKS